MNDALDKCATRYTCSANRVVELCPDLNHPYHRWRWTLLMTLKARYREPYNARHSFVSWNLRHSVQNNA